MRRGLLAGLSLLFCNISILSVASPGVYNFMFYNCENLFDPIDDPHTSDNEFLPHSRRNWTWQKYQQKLENISKVILATGIEPPIVIGLAEIENAFVLKQLTTKTGLARFGYKVVHHDSPDPRGIDVGVLYRPARFRLVSSTYYRVVGISKNDESLRTRDIVYLKGILCMHDTIHVFYNHWPSRRSNSRGDTKEHNRIVVAKILRSKVDSILKKNASAQIIIMGDFNDEPHNTSIVQYLGADGNFQPAHRMRLYNWSTQWQKNLSWLGTYKYKNHWNIFDQIITSYALVPQGSHKVGCIVRKADIFAPSFLLIPDDKYGTRKPYRTYNGMKYVAGFSDHLPVLLTFECLSCQAR